MKNKIYRCSATSATLNKNETSIAVKREKKNGNKVWYGQLRAAKITEKENWRMV